jgi:hypothetical protein
MKPQIRNFLNLLVILGLLSTVITSCTKKDDNPDLASIIAGSYNGTVTASGIGSAAGTTTIVRVNETRVNLVIVIGASSIPVTGVDVSNPSTNTYNLSYSQSGETLSGTVTGNTFIWTLTSGTDVIVFSGTR